MDCPACHAPVPPEEIRASRLVARCAACDATLELELVGEELRVASFREPAPPDSLTIDVDEAPSVETGGSYRDAFSTKEGRFKASWRWFSPVHIFLLVFAGFWDTFLVFWYIMAFTGGAPLLFFVFPLLHLAAGALITWMALSGLLNRTTVSVEDGRLETTHGPIPVPFDKSEAARLEDVLMFVVETVASRTKNRTRVTYKVDARMKDGSTQTVVTRLKDEAVAKFVQRRLERQLKPQSITSRVRVDAREEAGEELPADRETLREEER